MFKTSQRNSSKLVYYYIGVLFAVLPVCSLNSTMAFIVFESARAMSQKSLVLPQPSWRSTFMASSSSLNTCYRQEHKVI